jgi:photosystem II stability/assembly factor-like uncharacterized protein
MSYDGLQVTFMKCTKTPELQDLLNIDRELGPLKEKCVGPSKSMSITDMRQSIATQLSIPNPSEILNVKEESMRELEKSIALSQKRVDAIDEELQIWSDADPERAPLLAEQSRLKDKINRVQKEANELRETIKNSVNDPAIKSIVEKDLNETGQLLQDFNAETANFAIIFAKMIVDRANVYVINPKKSTILANVALKALGLTPNEIICPPYQAYYNGACVAMARKTTTIDRVVPIASTDFVSSKLAFQAGYEGLLKSEDGGITWHVSQKDMGFAVTFANGQIGWFASSSDTEIFKTTDGGNSWTALPIPQKFYAQVLYAPHDEVLFVQGNFGITKVTRDGGLTWTDAKLPTRTDENFRLERLQFSSVNQIFAYGAFVQPPSETLPFDVSTYGVWRSDNGGESWIQLSDLGSRGSEQLFVLNSETMWLSSSNGISATVKRSSDGGKTWEPALTGPRFREIYSLGFYNKEIGWAVGPLIDSDKIVLAITGDGGKTWTMDPDNRVNVEKDQVMEVLNPTEVILHDRRGRITKVISP